MVGVEDLRSSRTHPLLDCVGRTEESRRFNVAAAVVRQIGKAFENEGNADVASNVGGDAKRFLSIAFGLFSWRKRHRGRRGRHGECQPGALAVPAATPHPVRIE
jgi:hypothetical protein